MSFPFFERLLKGVVSSDELHKQLTDATKEECPKECLQVLKSMLETLSKKPDTLKGVYEHPRVKGEYGITVHQLNACVLDCVTHPTSVKEYDFVNKLLSMIDNFSLFMSKNKKSFDFLLSDVKDETIDKHISLYNTLDKTYQDKIRVLSEVCRNWWDCHPTKSKPFQGVAQAFLDLRKNMHYILHALRFDVVEVNKAGKIHIVKPSATTTTLKKLEKKFPSYTVTKDGLDFSMDPEMPDVSKEGTTTISVVNETLARVSQSCSDGFAAIAGDKDNTGGRAPFRGGLEEWVTLTSSILQFIFTPELHEMYPLNKTHPLFVNVTIFTDDEGFFVEDVKPCAYLVIYGCNCNKEFKRVDKHTRQEFHRRMIYSTLSVAKENGYTHLILPALSTGYFGYDPYESGQDFCEVLKLFQGCFSCITFAYKVKEADMFKFNAFKNGVEGH